MNIMKIKYYLFTIYLLATLQSCEKIDIPREAETEKYKTVYMPTAVELNRMEITHVDTNYTLPIGAVYAGGLDYAPADLPVTFEISLDSVQAYNQANGTAYKPLPLSSIEASTLTTSIAKGTIASPLLPIRINPTKGMDLFEDYLLPITVKGSFEDGIYLDQKLATAYYIVRSKLNFDDFQDFDRKDWKIVGFSSQEETGEGPNNGRAIFLLDNDYATFWHTRWSGGNAPGPHFVEIDMGHSQTIHGLSFVGRVNGGRGRPERVKLAVKNVESEDWTEIESNISLQNTRDIQRLFLKKPVEARYFKLTVEKTYENTEFTFLAELNVF